MLSSRAGKTQNLGKALVQVFRLKYSDNGGGSGIHLSRYEVTDEAEGRVLTIGRIRRKSGTLLAVKLGGEGGENTAKRAIIGVTPAEESTEGGLRELTLEVK